MTLGKMAKEKGVTDWLTDNTHLPIKVQGAKF